MLFRGVMLFRWVIWMFRRVVYCLVGLYAVLGGYMLFRRVKWMFREVICCSGGLYAVQEGYMIKKIMMGLAATSADASRPTGTPTACAKIWDIPQTNRGGAEVLKGHYKS